MNTEMIKLLIWVVPLAIFLLFLVFGIIFGLIRGFRKSLILGIQALIIFVGLTIAYAIIVNNPQTDGAIVSITNNFMGAGGLQKAMNVSEENTTFTAIMVELLSKNTNNYGEAINTVVGENMTYIATLANIALRLVLAIVVMVAYLLLVFIFYLIYLIFYPERRHKARKEKAYAELKTKKPYSKHAILGMLVGLVRGLASGLVIISFIGSFFYIVVGDSGERNYEKLDFGNEQMNQYYDIYTGISSYGNNGIFKVLNLLKNKNGLPYYLYATDLVFSSTYEKDGKVVNFRTTEEFGSYSGFARNTVDLLVKHGNVELKQLFESNASQDEILNTVTEIMQKEAFQTEFNKMIDEFEAGHYFSNFALSLVDSIAAHVDELNLKGDSAELLKIVFKKGYLSPNIASEKELIDAGTTVGDKPYLTASALLTKNDTKEILNLAIGIMSLNVVNMTRSGNVDVSSMLNISGQVLPCLKKLSILSDEKRKTEVNPVLQRVYTYVYENQFTKALNSLTGENNKAESIDKLLAENTTDTTDWVKEIQNLLDVGISVVTLGKNVYDPTKDYKDTNVLVSLILSIFEGEQRANNIREYDKIKNSLAQSQLVDMLLQISSINKLVFDNISKMSPGMYIPKNIKFVNVGETKGEMYNLLDSFEKMLKNDDLRAELKKIIDNSGQSSNVDIKSLFNMIGALTDEDENHEKIVDSVVSSTILRSFLSSMLINNKNIGSGIELYIPNSVLTEVDGEYVNLIQKTEMVNIVESVSDLSNAILDFVDEGEYKNDLDHLVSELDESILIKSVVIEGSISNILKDKLSSVDKVAVPTELTTSLDGWMTHTVDNNKVYGETYKILHSIKLSGIAISTFTAEGGATEDRIMEAIEALTDTQLDVLLDSRVIHYTVSNVIETINMGEINLIVPNDHRVFLTNDTIDYLVTKDELKKFVLSSTQLLDGATLATITPELILSNFSAHKEELLDCDIIGATFVNYLANSGDSGVSTFLKIPTDLKNLAEPTVAIYEYTKTNPWFEELGDLVTGFDEMIDLSVVDLSDNDSIKDSAMEAVKSFNTASKADNTKTKLNICHNSIIIWLTITNLLDEAFNPVLSDGRKDALNTIKDAYDATHTGLEYLSYTEAEISAIVDSANVLDLDVNNVEVSNVLSTINTFNTPMPEYGNKTKLNVLYGSDIIKCVLADKLDEALTASVVANDVRESSAVKYLLSPTIKVYKETEVSALLDALVILGIDDVTNFDADDVKNEILSLNDAYDTADLTKGSKLDRLYVSVILVFILKDKLDIALNDANVHQEVIESTYELHSDVNKNYYKKAEVSKIIELLDYIGITDVSTIDTTTLTNNLLDDSFDISKLYESNITIDLLSTNAKSIFDSSETIVDHDEAKEQFGTTGIYFYKQDEFVNMKAMLNKQNVTDFNNFAATDLVIDDDTITYILGSYILMATVSKNVYTNTSVVVPTLALTDPDSAYSENSNIISETEISILLNSIKAFGNSINGFDMDDIVIDSEKENAILASLVLKATVSKNIVDNANVIVSKSALTDATSTYSEKENYISDEELEALLDVLVLLQFSANGFDVSTLVPNDNLVANASTVAASIIVRANITKNIKNENDPTKQIYVSNNDAYAIADEDLGGTNIVILTYDEMVNLISAFNTLTNGASFDADIDLQTIINLTIDEQVEILKSNVVLHIVSDVLATSSITVGPYDLNYANIRLSMDHLTVKNSADETVANVEFDTTTDLDPLAPTCIYKFNAPKNETTALILSGGSGNTSILDAEDVLVFADFMRKAANTSPEYHYMTDYGVKN